MKLCAKMLRTLLYLAPRALLFGIFVLCFFITVFVSLDYLIPYENPLEVLMVKAIRGVRGFSFGEPVKKKGGKLFLRLRRKYERPVYPETGG